MGLRGGVGGVSIQVCHDSFTCDGTHPCWGEEEGGGFRETACERVGEGERARERGRKGEREREGGAEREKETGRRGDRERERRREKKREEEKERGGNRANALNAIAMVT